MIATDAIRWQMPQWDRAYLVRVNLSELAGNLARWKERFFGVDEARRWLIQTQFHDLAQPGQLTALGHLEFSPFQPTEEDDLFYSFEDPSTWLEPSEIVEVRPARPYSRRVALIRSKEVAL